MGYYKIVKFLVKNKADVNAKNRWGYTPISMTKNQKIIDYLISKGANKSEANTNQIHYMRLNENDNFYRYPFDLESCTP